MQRRTRLPHAQSGGVILPPLIEIGLGTSGVNTASPRLEPPEKEDLEKSCGDVKDDREEDEEENEFVDAKRDDESGVLLAITEWFKFIDDGNPSGRLATGVEVTSLVVWRVAELHVDTEVAIATGSDDALLMTESQDDGVVTVLLIFLLLVFTSLNLV